MLLQVLVIGELIEQAPAGEQSRYRDKTTVIDLILEPFMLPFVRAVAKRFRSARRQDFILSHPRLRGIPSVDLVEQPAVNGPERIHATRRLLKAYKIAHAEEASIPIGPAEDDLWTNLVTSTFGQLLQILDADDPEALANYLLHFGETYTWFGGLTFSLDAYVRSEDRSRVALTYFDKLICLAESLGVLPVEHPEHGRWGQNLYLDIADTIRGIETVLGISIAPPLGAVHVVGIKTPHGVFHYRHLNAIYTAHRLHTLLSKEGGAVCEYGGGLGVVALYARRMGISDYTLIDIPLTNLFAGHFLINSIGAQAVSLYGETQRPDSIKILPFWKCLDAPNDAFRISINQDSFPEVDEALVRRYLREIGRTTQEYFLSINHEAQSTMTPTRQQLNISTILKDYANFTRQYRSRYWLREGYLEELYKVAR